MCPGWGAAPSRRQAEYLVFCLGPEAGERAWTKALEKVTKRAAAWSALGLGLNLTTMAQRLRLISHDVSPAAGPAAAGLARTGAASFRRLAPGPGKWVLPMDPHALRVSLGLPQSFTKLEDVDLAAKFRVAHREASGESRVDE